MTYNIYGCRDMIRGSFGSEVIVDTSDEAVKRGFQMSMARAIAAGLPIGVQAHDFSYFRLGSIDSDTGVITALPQPVFLFAGSDIPRDMIEYFKANMKGVPSNELQAVSEE